MLLHRSERETLERTSLSGGVAETRRGRGGKGKKSRFFTRWLWETHGCLFLHAPLHLKSPPSLPRNKHTLSFSLIRSPRFPVRCTASCAKAKKICCSTFFVCKVEWGLQQRIYGYSSLLLFSIQLLKSAVSACSVVVSSALLDRCSIMRSITLYYNNIVRVEIFAEGGGRVDCHDLHKPRPFPDPTPFPPSPEANLEHARVADKPIYFGEGFLPQRPDIQAACVLRTKSNRCSFPLFFCVRL